MTHIQEEQNTMAPIQPDGSNLPVLPNAICVGQAFDIYGKYDPSSFMGSLFNPKASSSPQTVDGKIYLVPDYIEAINIAKGEEQKQSGSSREEFQKSIAASAKISSKYGAFSGQFTAAFSSVEHAISEYMYAHTTYYDWIYQMQLRTAGDLEPYLSDSFKQAVANLPAQANTPDQIAAFFRFFSTYGAYYTRQVSVGASLEFYVAVSTTSNLNSSSVRAAMDAHYHGLFVSGSISAEMEQSQLWQSYKTNSVIILRVSGGDDVTRAKLSAIDEKTPGKDTSVKAYDEWKATKGTTPIVTYMQLAPIYNLCGNKAEIVAEAWSKIWPTLHPNLYIETSSEDSPESTPVVILSTKNQPIRPTNPKTSNMGCMVAMLNRKTLETLEATYYCFNSQTWKFSYSTVFNQVAQDLLKSEYYNQDSILVFLTMGLVGYTARPTPNLYSLLLLAGGGKGLQAWRDKPETYVNYVLIGIPTMGAGQGAESYSTTSKQPETMRTGAYFYKSFSAQLYDVALNPNPLPAQLSPDSEEESHSLVRQISERTPEDILAYWTPERMAQAQPVPSPFPDDEYEPKSSASPAAGAPDAHIRYQTGKVLPEHIDKEPWRCIGRLFFTRGNELFSGSASVVTESGLITAAHNLYDRATKTWAENIVFYPAYTNDAQNPKYGSWTATSMGVPRAWIEATPEKALDYDVGFIELHPGGNGFPSDIGIIVGEIPLRTNLRDLDEDVRWQDIGYPCVPLDGYDFDGAAMWCCIGNYVGEQGAVVQKAGNLTKGASGGPWILEQKGKYEINGIDSLFYKDKEINTSSYFGVWVGLELRKFFRV